ncbi:HNH endonuclease signature motif containing protein [Paenibacillus sp. LjRoot153]|uniref:HNH endonuclease signature motif containing protein n=1 Tax=Paenibacillus sp. LjRoot153 TaxID=3342270 RepID=UPI003ECE69F3
MARDFSKKQVNPFYKSSAWLKCRVFALTRDNHLCQPCLRKKRLTPATIVHHINPFEEFLELALEPDNLESVCASCHNKEHPEKGGGGKKKEQSKRKAVVVKSEANAERW